MSFEYSSTLYLIWFQTVFNRVSQLRFVQKFAGRLSMVSLIYNTNIHCLFMIRYTYGKPVTGCVNIEAGLAYKYDQWSYSGWETLIQLYNISMGVSCLDKLPIKCILWTKTFLFKTNINTALF